MILLIDTREQNPLQFSHPYISATERQTLIVGDYQVCYKDGYIPPVAFERKSIADLFGTMTQGYKRFKRLMEKANDHHISLILIMENSYTTVSNGYCRSEYSGKSMIKKLMTLWLKYDLVPVFCRNRTEMADYIVEYFCAIGRLKGKRLLTYAK